MNIPDEPVLRSEFEGCQDLIAEVQDVARKIANLLAAQPFGVLCTQGWGQPYGAVVAFAYHPGLSEFAFATPTTTRKFRLLEESSGVALVIDSRSLYPDDMMKVEAVTVTGSAERLAESGARRLWAERIAERHRYLREFLFAPSTALFRVDVCRYFYVSRFQEVTQWVPPRSG